MRVTKLIREYVEESVRQKFKPEKAKVWKEYDERREALREEIQKIVDEANEKAVALAREAGLYLDSEYNSETIIRMYGRYIGNREIEAKLREKDRELADRERDTIASVLLGLELGQTDKTELESVLAAIEV